jgi:predicted deacylase
MSYLSREAIIDGLKSLCDSHSDLCGYRSIGKTVENRDMWMFQIGNNPLCKIHYDASIHGNEPVVAETLGRLMIWLITSEDEYATKYRKYCTCYMMPIVNMDKYRVQRKNANNVDLNRNFPYNWTSGGSTDPASYQYRGTAPASEPETQNIIKFWNDYKPHVYINLHTGQATAPVNFHANGWTAEDQSKFSQIWTIYKSLQAKLGGTNQGSGFSNVGNGGFAINEACAKGILASVSETTPEYSPPYADIDAIYYPRYKPLGLAFMEFFGKEPSTVVPPAAEILPDIYQFATMAWSYIMFSYIVRSEIKGIKVT